MKDTDLAYAAGLLDGEAYIGIKKNPPKPGSDRVSASYHHCIQVRMVDEGAIKFLSDLFGGSYSLEKPHAAKGRPLYCWALGNKRAVYALAKVLPYLRVKRRQAEVVLEFAHLRQRSYNFKTKVVGYKRFPNARGKIRVVASMGLNDRYLERCEHLYQLCKKLKRS
jgi:hypothetical protein